VGIFSSKPQFFTAKEQQQIIAAIQQAEKKTSGEIRIYVESRNPLVSSLERAQEIFFKLKMDKTQNRNAVLIYLAMKDHELVLFADEGIYIIAGAGYWDAAVQEMITAFKQDEIVTAIENCIHKVGITLQNAFPYLPNTDKNELPDEIIFGK
jgi:uncharacterized membrane protein